MAFAYNAGNRTWREEAKAAFGEARRKVSAEASDSFRTAFRQTKEAANTTPNSIRNTIHVGIESFFDAAKKTAHVTFDALVDAGKVMASNIALNLMFKIMRRGAASGTI